MTILDKIQDNLNLWPNLKRPLDSPWHQITMPYFPDGNPPYLRIPHVHQNQGRFFTSSNLPAIDDIPMITIELKREIWFDPVDKREIEIYIGQCEECSSVYWTLYFNDYSFF